VNAARAFVLLCSILAAPACGSTTSASPADNGKPTPAPPIEAIDEPAPDAGVGFQMSFGDEDSSDLYLCGQRGASGPEECKPTADQVERAQRMAAELEQAVKPATGTEPRAIALLPLSRRGPNARARIVTWRSQSDELCIETDVEEGNGGSGDGPWGPCVPSSHCDRLCLSLSALGDGRSQRYLLGGVVSSEGDSLRLTLDGGRVVAYELTGPKVPGFPEYRVFMLDLGRDLDQQQELLRDGKTLAEERRSPEEMRMLRCEEDFPPALPSQDRLGQSTPVVDCFERASPK